MRRSRLTVLLCAALATTALAGAGCGKTAKPLTRAQLILKADAVCRRINRKLSATTIKSQQDIARLAPQLASYEQEALADFNKLIPPPAMAGDWKEIVTGAQTLADNIDKLGEYVKSKNTPAARQLIASTQKVQERVVATAKRNGFKDCAHTA